MSSIDDVTQRELREVEMTGRLHAGEKALAELRKRKLAIQKYAPILRIAHMLLKTYQKTSVVHCIQRPELQRIA